VPKSAFSVSKKSQFFEKSGKKTLISYACKIPVIPTVRTIKKKCPRNGAFFMPVPFFVPFW